MCWITQIFILHLKPQEVIPNLRRWRWTFNNLWRLRSCSFLSRLHWKSHCLQIQKSFSWSGWSYFRFSLLWTHCSEYLKIYPCAALSLRIPCMCSDSLACHNERHPDGDTAGSMPVRINWLCCSQRHSFFRPHVLLPKLYFDKFCNKLQNLRKEKLQAPRNERMICMYSSSGSVFRLMCFCQKHLILTDSGMSGDFSFSSFWQVCFKKTHIPWFFEIIQSFFVCLFHSFADSFAVTTRSHVWLEAEWEGV